MYDEEFDDDGGEFPDYTPPITTTPPDDLKLTVEVGLSQYSPSGLLGFIASALVKDIGGRDKWVQRFRELLEQEGKSKLSGLIDSEASLLFQDHRTELRTLIEQGFKTYFEEVVGSDGKPNSGYSRQDNKTRMQWLVESLAREAVTQAWEEIEAETKAQWVADIKAVVTDLMTARVERSLPPPKIGQT